MEWRSLQRLFLDTSYVIALLNPKDKHHTSAMRARQQVRDAGLVITTHLILSEIGDAFCSKNRDGAALFIRQLLQTTNTQIVGISTALFGLGLSLYSTRPDKQWGLTDCISFVVMEQNGIALAATADHHFVQAGFTALMLE